MLTRTTLLRSGASRLLAASSSGRSAVVAAGRSAAIRSVSVLANPPSFPSSWNATTTAATTSTRTFSSVPTELSDILTRELAEEESNETTVMPTELDELKSHIEESWRVVDGSSLSGSGGATIKLFKKDPLEGSGSKVAVAFHCQDTIAPEEEEDGGSFFGEEEEEEEDAVAVRFTVMVSRAGKTMVYTCVSDEATVNVERVCMVDRDDVETLINDGIDEKSYQGPEFSELAEDLQQSLCSYVDEVCGVDSDVAAFVSMYADYKEQVEYFGWLKSVKSMI